MATVSEREISEACLKWLKEKSPARSIAVTVTFNRTIDGRLIAKQTAEDAVRVFCRKLNSKAFGNSFRNKQQQLVMIPVHEGGRSAGEKHPHCHFLIEAPVGWSTDAWMRAVKELIFKMRWFSRTQYDIEPVTDGGWLEYILKRRDKKSFADAIDFANLWVNA